MLTILNASVKEVIKGESEITANYSSRYKGTYTYNWHGTITHIIEQLLSFIIWGSYCIMFAV